MLSLLKLLRSSALPGFETIEACLAQMAGSMLRRCACRRCIMLLAAEPLLAAGVDLLIEKPLAASLADADRILELAASTVASCRRGILSASILR